MFGRFLEPLTEYDCMSATNVPVVELLEQHVADENLHVKDIEWDESAEEVAVTFYFDTANEEKERIADLLHEQGFRHVRSQPTHQYDSAKIPGCMSIYRLDD